MIDFQNIVSRGNVFFPRAMTFLSNQFGQPINPLDQDIVKRCLNEFTDELKPRASHENFDRFFNYILGNNLVFYRQNEGELRVISEKPGHDHTAISLAQPLIKKNLKSETISEDIKIGYLAPKVSTPFITKAIYMYMGSIQTDTLFLKLLALEWFLLQGKEVFVQTITNPNITTFNLRLSPYDRTENTPQNAAEYRRQEFLKRHRIPQTSDIGHFLKLAQDASLGISSQDIRFTYLGENIDADHLYFIPYGFYELLTDRSILLSGSLIGIKNGHILSSAAHHNEPCFIYDGHTLSVVSPNAKLRTYNNFNINPVVKADYDGASKAGIRGHALTITGHKENATFIDKDENIAATQIINRKLSSALNFFISRVQTYHKTKNYYLYKLLYTHNTEAGRFSVYLIKKHRLSNGDCDSYCDNYDTLLSQPLFAEAFDHFPTLFASLLHEFGYEHTTQYKAMTRRDFVNECLFRRYDPDTGPRGREELEREAKWEYKVRIKPIQNVKTRLMEAINTRAPLTPILKDIGYNKTIMKFFLNDNLRTIKGNISLNFLFHKDFVFILERILTSGILPKKKGGELTKAKNNIYTGLNRIFYEYHKVGLNPHKSMEPRPEWITLFPLVHDTINVLFTIFGLFTPEWDYQELSLRDLGVIGDETGMRDLMHLTKMHHAHIERFDQITSVSGKDNMQEEWELLMPEPYSCEYGTLKFLGNKQALRHEGLGMSHCVGGYSCYCRTGEMFIASVVGNDGTRGTLSLAGPGSKDEVLGLSEFRAEHNQDVTGNALDVYEHFKRSAIFHELKEKFKDNDFCKTFTHYENNEKETQEAYRVREVFISDMKANYNLWSGLFRTEKAARRYIEIVERIHSKLFTYGTA